MDIKSGCGYPASSLSNFAPHPFVFDGVECNSFEGLCQSWKFSNPDMQKYICTLVGYAAKKAGRNKNWQSKQILYWQGVEYKRDSKEYQDLLDRAYIALAQNTSFRSALLATQNAVLEHSIGKSKISETVLTRQEFCSRLMKLRHLIKHNEI
jgi:predicted NAD-dependent protein-ADP-ribosyltransferase YbiA (DUF1768 family)